MKHFKKIVGNKVYLSPINLEDAYLYTKWFNSFDVTDYMGNGMYLFSFPLEKNAIKRMSSDGSYEFSIVNLETNQLLGNIGLFGFNQNKTNATVGLLIGESNERHHGYGTEALNLILDYGFNYLHLNNIMLFVYSCNKVAIDCYKKIGFQEIGRRRKAYFVNGNYYDIIYMDILKDEFNQDYIKNKYI